MKKLLLLNGPNLNRLGKREPAIYGSDTLQDVEERFTALAHNAGYEVTLVQSNHEGRLIDAIHEAADEKVSGIVFNPGAFTHTSYALRDALSSVDVPAIEIHISNVHARESFRHTSLLSAVTIGQIVGFGVYGYELAFLALDHHLGGMNHE